MTRRPLSYILAAALLVLTPAGILPAQGTLAKTASLFREEPASLSDADGNGSDGNLPISGENNAYKEGRALVTLAAPSKTSLSKKGITKSDREIQVEETWDFGDARLIGKNKEEKKFLEDKTLYISEVSSDTYSTNELIRELKDNAYVLSVEPDYYQQKMSSPDKLLSQYQWHLDGDGAYKTESEGIHYSKGRIVSSERQPIVAVMDTGVDYTHEDLAENMWINPYETLDGVYGYDFGDDDPDPMDEDDDGHGTHCAGSIAAINDNEVGICGVADSAQIMALKVFDSKGQITNSYIIDALNYIYKAQQLGADIAAVNCSWGGGSSDYSMNLLMEKIGQMGALFLFAAGNDAEDQDNVRNKQCPYDLTNNYIVITGASNTKDKAASFSDYGKSVHLFAPGTQILSTGNKENFAPAFYSEERRAELCSFYSSCSDDDFTLYTPADLGIASYGTSYLGVEHSTVDTFNDTEDGSLCSSFFMSRSPGKKNDIALYMDVTDLRLNKWASYYISFDAGYVEGQNITWEHFNAKMESGDLIEKYGKVYLLLVNLSPTDKSLEQLYIDNPAVSKANPDTEEFGKYLTMNGTSMSAPLVSGAVANLACVYPDDTAGQRKLRLLNCTRSCSSLTEYCSTGGILDLEKISTAKTTPSDSSSPSSSAVWDPGQAQDNGTVPMATQPPASAQTPTATQPPSSTQTPDTAEPEPPKKILVQKVKLNKSSASLRYKKKLKLKAAVNPKNASNKTVKWSSSKKKYATVTQKGVVKAKKKGIGHSVKIYAKAKDNSGKKAYCKVKIIK